MFPHLPLSQGSFQSFHSLGFEKFLLDIGEHLSGFAAGPKAQGVAVLPPRSPSLYTHCTSDLFQMLVGLLPPASD